MQVTNDAKDVIVGIIDYFTKKQVLGITYAEAIDANTVAQLNVSLTNDMPDGDRNIPANRISLLSCTEDDRKLVKDVLLFLRTNDTTGFDYDMEIPDTEQKLHIHVELRQTTTGN